MHIDCEVGLSPANSVLSFKHIDSRIVSMNFRKIEHIIAIGDPVTGRRSVLLGIFSQRNAASLVKPLEASDGRECTDDYILDDGRISFEER